MSTRLQVIEEDATKKLDLEIAARPYDDHLRTNIRNEALPAGERVLTSRSMSRVSH